MPKHRPARASDNAIATNVILFPTIRRHQMIVRNAAVIAERTDPDRSLNDLLRRIRAAHERKGIDPQSIAADIRQAEAILRAEIARRRLGRSA